MSSGPSGQKRIARVWLAGSKSLFMPIAPQSTREIAGVARPARAFQAQWLVVRSLWGYAGLFISKVRVGTDLQMVNPDVEIEAGMFTTDQIGTRLALAVAAPGVWLSLSLRNASERTHMVKVWFVERPTTTLRDAP